MTPPVVVPTPKEPDAELLDSPAVPELIEQLREHDDGHPGGQRRGQCSQRARHHGGGAAPDHHRHRGELERAAVSA